MLFNIQNYNIFVISDKYADIVDKYKTSNKLDEKEKQIINEILDISEYSEIGENGVKATKYDIKKRLNRLTFVLTNACNLRCEYCYEDGNGETKFDYLNNEKMDFNIAKYYINTLFEVYDSVDTVMFFGGEPALELDMMEEICDYIDSLYMKKNIANRPNFGIITNGTIITEKHLSFFKKYSFQITLSIDGPEHIHDYFRKDIKGGGSFLKIKNNIKKIQKSNLNHGIQATYSIKHVENNITPYDLAEYFFKTFKIILPHIVPGQFPLDSKYAWNKFDEEKIINTYLNSLNKIIDLTERGDFENIYFFSFIFSIIVGLIKKNKFPLICPAGTELAVSPSGDLFPCFMLINKNDDFLLKRFDDKFVEQKFIDKLTKFMYKNIKSANNECRDCYARYLCHGCVGSNYNVNDDIGINERMNCLLMQSIVKEAILKIATISLDSNRWSNFVTNMGKILNTTKRTESAC